MRHAETARSTTGQHIGFTNNALTRHGKDEARELAPCLKMIRFTRMLSSHVGVVGVGIVLQQKAIAVARGRGCLQYGQLDIEAIISEQGRLDPGWQH